MVGKGMHGKGSERASYVVVQIAYGVTNTIKRSIRHSRFDWL